MLGKATDFSDDMKDRINETRKSQFRVLDLHLLSQYTEHIDENLADWEVVSLSATEIEILLTFKDPLQVSSGWDNDMLTVDVNLAPYYNRQRHVIPRQILWVNMPSQMSSAAEKEILADVAVAQGAATDTCFALSVGQYLAGFSLGQVWGTLNSLHLMH